MTEEQAIEIRKHLESEMEQHGYGSISQQALFRMTETLNEKENINIFENSRGFLLSYLRNITEIFNTLSSHHLEADVSHINTNLEGTNKITSVSLQTNTSDLYPLANLPDYRPIVKMLDSIYNQIIES